MVDGPCLLDSDVIIDSLAGLPASVELLLDLSATGLAISVITFLEAYEGVARSPNSRARAQFESFIAGIPVIPLAVAEARRCSEIREDLRRRSRRIRARALDLLIAATAIEHDLRLVTRNIDDYRDIPGLRLYEPLSAG